VDEIMQKLLPLMDTSNYPLDHPLYDASKANQLTYWKNETKNEIVVQFVGICAKTYSLQILSSGNKMITQSKCKGVNKTATKQTSFEDYKKCIDQITSHRATVYDIRSKDHVIRTVKSDRLCFSSFDDKRYILS
jgi:hypothetical protein